MWQEIFRDTDSFLSPKIIQSPDYIPFSLNDFSSVFEGAKQDLTEGKINYFRGYRNGMEDYCLAENFLESDFDKLPLTQIINEYFGSNEAINSRKGLIVNGVLQWSKNIHNLMAGPAQNFADIYHNNLITVDVTLFVGAYGNTPFGAHVDDLTHRTILINFGPSKKCIHIWENSNVEAQFGKVTNVFFPEKIQAQPDKYCFSPGQMFVLPSSRYHMAINNDLSTTAAIVVDIISKSKAAVRELALLEKFISNKDKSVNDLFSKLSIKELAEIHAKRCKSNGYFRYPISLKEIKIEEINKESLLKISDNKSIQLHSLNNHYLILSNGHHYLVKKPKNNFSFAKLFGSNNTSVSNIISFVKESGEDIKSALLLIKFLLQSDSVEIIG
jgi:hypothetical protein